MNRHGALILLWSRFAVSAIAQPRIQAISDLADGYSDLAVGGFGSIYGNGLAGTATSAASVPWPTILGDTQVMICNDPTFTKPCIAAGLTYAGPTQINFYIPQTAPTGGARILVQRGGPPAQTSDDYAQSFPVTISAAAPKILIEGTDCFIDTRYQDANKNCGLTWNPPPTKYAIRGAVTDLQGKLLTSSNPARLGQYYTAWMTGIGRLSNDKTSGTMRMTFLNVSVYGYNDAVDAADNSITYVGESPQYPGLYQVNFQLPVQIAMGGGNWGSFNPPLFPCGNYSWEVTLVITEDGGPAGNGVSIPIVFKPGDAPCK